MELWTSAHAETLLPALAVMVALGFALRHTLGKKEHKIRMRVLQVLAVMLLALEVGKQTVSFLRGYDLYHIPLHYCSLVLFSVPLMAFYKGKHAQTVRSITCGVCAAVTVLTVIYPSLIYSAWDIEHFTSNFIAFHTVAFHNLAIFIFVVMLSLELHAPRTPGDLKHLALFILCFCAVSATAAQLLQTNYNNFYTCNIPPLEQLRQTVEAAAGSLVAKLLYVLIVTALDIAFTLGMYRLYALLQRALGSRVCAPAGKGEHHDLS